MKRWTMLEVETLRGLYPKHTLKEIEKIMGIPAKLIHGATKRYKIKSGRPGKFIKGNVSWNKGKNFRLSPATEFKKGNEPHNTKQDGTISIRKDKSGRYYKMIRLGKNNWVLLQRHIWKQHHGEIPAHLVLRFKDGNSLNCELDNLELITRGAHLSKNANRTKAAKTLRATYQRDRMRLKYGLPPISGHGPRLKNIY